MRWSRRGRWKQLALRLPVQAIYKFDDRRIVAGRIESGSLASRRRDRHHARRQDRQDQDGRELAGHPGQGQAGRRTFGRHHARPRAVRRARRRHCPCRQQPARHPPLARPHFLAARQAACQGRADPGPARHAGDPRHRGRDREGGRSRRIVERREQVDREATMSARSIFRWRIRSPPIPIPTIRAPGVW